jgi:hypothetical protein
MKTEARKSFRHGFVLTEQELRRIAGVATDQLEKIPLSQKPKTHIEVRFQNGTLTDSDSLDDLVSLENVGSKHIVRMHIGFTHEGDKSEHAIGLTFTDTDQDDDPRPISYIVRGPDRDWVFVTASELEERIAKVKSFSPQRYFSGKSRVPFSAIGLLFSLTIFFVMMIALDHRQPSAAQSIESQWKAGALRDPIEAIIIQQRYQETERRSLGPRTVFGWAIGLPVAIMILFGALTSLSAYLFPAYVFSWGDYTKLYERRVQVRKYVLGVVLVSLVIGVIASMIANMLTHGR